MFVKRDGVGVIIEAVVIPPAATFSDWEQVRDDDPGLKRFVDPTYSFKTEMRKRFKEDPALMLIFERIRQATEKTKAEEVAIYDAIADAILPD